MINHHIARNHSVKRVSSKKNRIQPYNIAGSFFGKLCMSKNMETFVELGIAFRSLIMVAGILGNILIILVYVRKRIRTSTDVFILSLGIADLSVCVAMPLKIFASYNRSYTNSGLCKITHYFSLIGTFLSMFLTLCISIDRYFAVCRPLLKKKIVTPSRALKMAVGCLLLAAAVGSVALFSAGIRRAGPVSMCSIHASYVNIIHNYSFLILGLYCVSLFLIILIYIKIYKTLRNKALSLKKWSLRNRPNVSNMRDICGKKVHAPHKRGLLSKLNTFKGIKKVDSLGTREAWKPENATDLHEPGTSGTAGTSSGTARTSSGTARTSSGEINANASTSTNQSKYSTDGTLPHPFGLSSDRNIDNDLQRCKNNYSDQQVPPHEISIIYRSSSHRSKNSCRHLQGSVLASINEHRKRMKGNNISKMIFLVTVIYFVTWVPLLVFQCLPATVIMALLTKSEAGFTVVYLLTLALNVNHFINPIVYSFVNVRFRRECKATFERMKRLVIN
ncbi:D(2) dopamine receptor-like [Lytechinus variegatus]|uniref:D(2) dopamine receptor-like n=1 Tax=Lytechinus variegatus TaxID=7654 RepID=UPI001BB2CCA2|nr:D(2) dopamine receptor-like [Lytechinus variegatus]